MLANWRLSTAALIILAGGSLATAQMITVEVELPAGLIEGAPLRWSHDDVTLLARDGGLLRFAPDEARRYRKTADGFRGYSQAEMRARLSREFGPAFEVSGTGNYLVVHPAGQRDTWADRFEQLYRSFVQYFTARGWRPQRPAFPLVAVVFPQRQAFLAYAARQGVRLPPQTVGFYSRDSNRILIYDVTAGRSAGEQEWSENAATIIHEAAHQAAFNTQVHSRYAPPPLWVAEGLGTMFEARGVWDARHFTAFGDRLHQDHCRTFRRNAATRRPAGGLADFVSSDRAFQSDPRAAYAESWALTFFLAETRPRAYCDYLRKTASRPRFSNYPAPQRLRDFTDVFGSDLEMLEARFLRFIDENTLAHSGGAGMRRP